MVDAVVRCLLKGGWINFRMRAMIFSFAHYNLWLHWCAWGGSRPGRVGVADGWLYAATFSSTGQQTCLPVHMHSAT